MSHPQPAANGFFITLLLLTLTASPLAARELLPNFDARRVTSKPELTTVQSNAVVTLRGEGAQAEFDPLTGAARLVAARDKFLTGKLAARGGATVEHAALKNFLNTHRALFGHGADALTNARVAHDSTGAHNGLRSVVWAQQRDGVEIFGARLAAHTTRDGELVRVASDFVSGVTNTGVAPAPSLTARQAASLAAAEISETVSEIEIAVTNAVAGDAAQPQQLRAPNFRGGASARLVWLPTDKTTLRLCWEIVWVSRARDEMFRTVVDATTGQVWLRHGLTAQLTPATFNVFTNDSPTPFSPGWPNSLSNTQPPTVSRTLVTLAALNTNASPAGWIDDAGNETRGNNVDAHTDWNNDNVADTPRPQGSPFRVFDFPLNLASDPTNSTSAAIVQLFYVNNWIHDKLYELGFTEAAGNFQSNNFGRGGLGNDAVQADAQDSALAGTGASFNNANFDTPPDGSSSPAPRMQMYLFTYPTPRRDGDLDVEVMIHEYTHGLSSRLVGGGAGISALQTSGMGEGWSDFYALCLLSEAGDDPHGNYASGAYASYQLGSTAFLNNYFFGIRSYPYTTDLTKNPLTFADIDPTLITLHPGIPRNNYTTITLPADAAEVHNQGEVWCVTLWEMRVRLVDKLGWATGNQLALQLVTDGMKLSPANPTFVQARDAILAAELVDTGGANRAELWTAFAKRGLGVSAIAPANSTTTGVIQAFDVPDDLAVRPIARMEFSAAIGGPFTNTATYTLTNAGTNSLTWSVSNSAAWLTVTPTNGALAASAVTLVTAAPNAAAAALTKGIYTANLAFTNVNSGVVTVRTFQLAVGLPNYFAELFDGSTRTNDLSFTAFTFTPLGTTNYAVCRNSATAFPIDPTGGNFVALTDDSFTNVTLTGTNTVALYGGRTNVISIGSNGYLSWGGDTDYSSTFAVHFNRRRLSLLFRDLNPGSGTNAKISWKQLADRLAVTYQAVPEYGSTTLTNNFQAELFFNGQIRVTFLALKTTGSLVGLSAGAGVPSDFLQSDLSALNDCQLPPIITVQPTNRIVGVTSNATFSVSTGVGNAPFAFQWRKNISPLTGATNSAYTNASAQLSDAGNYTLIVTNAFGAVTSSVATLTVTSPPPVVAFAALVTNGYAPLTVNFTNTTTGATNFTWTFGDGNTSSATNPANTFSNVGTFSVTLVAAGDGGIRSLTRTNYISVAALPFLVTPVFTSNNFVFTFATLAGKTYTVQYKDLLTDTNWLPLLPALGGTGGNRTFTNAPPGNQRYYRLFIQ